MEVGQKPQSTPMSTLISSDKEDLTKWLNGNGPNDDVWNKEQITRTRYDLSYEDGRNILGDDPSILVQRNLRNRVSYTMVLDTEPHPETTGATHRAATYYTYDIHGNVDTLLQDLRIAMASTETNRYKKIAYNYDLISGKVNRVGYQAGMKDQFFHKYEYDAENRITDVFTSHDNILWEHDARYGYYKHGPLARMILGQQQVQGVDYAYTLQGWLKGVNSTAAKQLDIITGEGADCGANSAVDNLLVNARAQPYSAQYKARTSILFENGFESISGDDFLAETDNELNSCGTNGTAGTVTPAPIGTNYHDIGQDGVPTQGVLLNPVANDAYGFGLNYFEGDYSPISSAVTPFASAPNPPLNGYTTGLPLYNGNINSMAVNIPKLGSAHLYAYRYDQLNRLKAMDAFTGLNNVENSWTPVATEKYRERVSYDANGNITTYERNGGATLQMDKLTYQYPRFNNSAENISRGLAGKIMNNRLRYVHDAYTTPMSEDIESNTTLNVLQVQEDLAAEQTGDNYHYDEIGNLIRDAKEDINAISWNVYGKISSIDKAPGKADISYTYDASGNRITKTVTPPTGGEGVTTVYVRDASGNVMAIYSRGGSENNGDLTQKEVHLYGSSRLGIYNTDRNVQVLGEADPNNKINSFLRGDKFFELSNHLGNVLVTVNDKKVGIDEDENGITDYYDAEIVTANDYYPFGMMMPGRDVTTIGKRSRHSINGQERSDELNDNLTTAEYWEYDTRIARRWNVDPVLKESESPFVAFGNNPITNVDPDGSDTIDIVKTKITERLKGNSNSGNTGVASMAGKTFASTNVGISIKGAEGVDVFRYKEVEINYLDGNEVGRKEGKFQELDIRGVANTAYRTRFSERARLAGLVPANLLDAYAEKNKNYDFPTYVGVLEAKALQSTIPFAQKLNKVQNTVYAISGTVQISKVVLTKLAQSGALFSINKGYGIQGKIGNYKYDLLYSNAAGTPGGTLFSVKQSQNGGNMIRIDYGKFHNPSGELGWHSTFRYNIFGKTYGSGAQYPVSAPLTPWLYPRKR